MKKYGFRRKEDYCPPLGTGPREIIKFGLASKFRKKKKKCGVYYSKYSAFKRLARLKIKKSERRYAKKQSMLLVFDFLTELTELI